MSHAHNDSSHCCAAELTADSLQDTRPLLAGHEKSTLRIEQMDCPTEERLIRDRLQRNPHVSGLHFNLLERLLQVHHAPGQLDSVVADIGALGMQAVPLRVGGGGPAMGETTSKSEASRLVAAGLLAAVAEGAELMQADSLLWTLLPALLSVLLIGGPIIRKGWIAIINRNLNINALMSIAVTGAFLIGHWPEAAMVTFLFALAELIEARSLTRARDAVRSLMVMTPETALVQQADASWQEQTVAEVAIGNLIRLAPGERVALDGEIVEGSSAFDQSSITGESLPVELGVGGAFMPAHSIPATRCCIAALRWPMTACWPALCTGCRKPRPARHRPSVLLMLLPASIRRWWWSLRFWWRCCRRCLLVATGWTGCTVRWCCW